MKHALFLLTFLASIGAIIRYLLYAYTSPNELMVSIGIIVACAFLFAEIQRESSTPN